MFWGVAGLDSFEICGGVSFPFLDERPFLSMININQRSSMLIISRVKKESILPAKTKKSMVRHLPITKARINLGAVVKQVHLNKEYVILEKDGIPLRPLWTLTNSRIISNYTI